MAGKHKPSKTKIMEVSLNVNDSTCIRCGKCVRVCPSKIFTQTAPGERIGLEYTDSCIVCGHCVAVCPTDSVEHADFPPRKVHKIDYALLPSPEQTMLLCKVRRSNRAFSHKPIPKESLDQILEAAHRAPTASNKQQVSFTMVTDPDKLRQVIEITVGVFSSLARKLEHPLLRPLLKMIMPGAYNYLPVLHRLEKAQAEGKDQILRGATALLLIHTPSDNMFGGADSNLAYQNASLMAESLGVSQFYTGFVLTGIQQDKTDKIARLLGIEGKVHAGMALGMPAFRYPKYIDKKDIQVTWI